MECCWSKVWNNEDRHITKLSKYSHEYQIVKICYRLKQNACVIINKIIKKIIWTIKIKKLQEKEAFGLLSCLIFILVVTQWFC